MNSTYIPSTATCCPLRIAAAILLCLDFTSDTVADVAATPSQSAAPMAPVPAAPQTSPAAPSLLNGWLQSQSPAFQPWNIGGDFRSRYENRSHYAIAGTTGSTDFLHDGPGNVNGYNLFRTRLHVGYEPVEYLRFYVQGRDSVAIEDDRHPSPDADRADIHQAWIAIGGGHGLPVSLQVGRQELSYGDERLVGGFDWTNVGRVFDAARLRYEDSRITADAFTGRLVLPDNHNWNVPNDYDWFSGLHLSSRSLIPVQETQLYFFSRNTGFDSPNTIGAGLPSILTGATPRDIYTLGLRTKSLPGKLHGWDYSFESAGQAGRFKDTANGPSLDHLAWAVHAGGGYTFDSTPTAPRVGLEYNFGSGDDNPNDGNHGTFENLFPTNHKFYGYMDLISWQNMHNPRLALSCKPAKTLAITADFHGFWLADVNDNFYQVNGARRGPKTPTSGNGFGINPDNDPWVGAEIDIVGTWSPAKWLSLQTGYGHFFVGDYIRQSLENFNSAERNADWVYLQALLKF